MPLGLWGTPCRRLSPRDGSSSPQGAPPVQWPRRPLAVVLAALPSPAVPADPGPDLRHDHVLPGGERGHLLCIAASCPYPLRRQRMSPTQETAVSPPASPARPLSPARAWSPLGLPASAAVPRQGGAGVRGFWRFSCQCSPGQCFPTSPVWVGVGGEGAPRWPWCWRRASGCSLTPCSGAAAGSRHV